MSPYSQYKGRCVGRILHVMYCLLPSWQAESVKVGDSEVLLHNERVATYKWDDVNADSDIPLMEFAKPEHTRKFFFLSPFLSSPAIDDVNFVVQEIQKVLTLSDVLTLRWLHKNAMLDHLAWHELDMKVRGWLAKYKTHPTIQADLNKQARHLIHCAYYDIENPRD